MDETLSQKAYRNALSNQKKTIQQNGNSLINQSVSNDANSLIATTKFETDSSQYKYTSTDANAIYNQSKIDTTTENKNTETKNYTWFDNLMGGLNNFFANLGGGLVGGLEGIVDLGAYAIGGMTGNQSILDWASHSYANDVTELLYADYYNDREVGGFEEFMNGVGQSIGFMLPSILTAGVASGAGASSAVAQGISLGVMGVGATGKGTEESYNETGDLGKAFINGLIDGGVEVATEIFVGKALGKIADTIGSKTANETLKSTMETLSKTFNEIGIVNKTASQSVTAFVGNMFEEGMEEVVGDIIKPTFQTIFNSKENAFADLTPAELGKSFLSGAVTTSIMSGGRALYTRTVYNNNLIEATQNLVEAKNQEKEVLAEKYGETDEEIANHALKLTQVQKATQIAIENFNNVVEEVEKNPTRKNKATINKLLGKSLSQTELNDYSKAIDKIEDTYGHQAYEDMTRDIQNKLVKNGLDVKIEWQDEKDFKNTANLIKSGVIDENTDASGFYYRNGNKVVLNNKYRNEVDRLIKHEIFSHAILDANETIRNKLADSIKELDEDGWNDAIQQVTDNGYDNPTKNTSEILAHYLQNNLSNNVIDRVMNSNDITRSRFIQFFNKIKNSLSKFKGLDKATEESLDKAIKSIQKERIIARLTNDVRVNGDGSISLSKTKKANTDDTEQTNAKSESTALTKTITEAKEVKQKQESTKTDAYVSMADTDNFTKTLVKQVTKSFESGYGNMFNVRNNLNNVDLEKKISQTINSKSLTTEQKARAIADYFLNLQIESMDEDVGKYRKLGAIRDSIAEEQIQDFYNNVESLTDFLIKNQGKEMPNEVRTLTKNLEKSIDDLKEAKAKINDVRILKTRIDKAQSSVKTSFEYNDDTQSKYGIKLIIDAISNGLIFDEKGVSIKPTFEQNLQNVLEKYVPDEKNSAIVKGSDYIPFNPVLQSQLEDIYAKLQQYNEESRKNKNAILDDATISKLKSVTKTINALTQQAIINNDVNVAQKAQQTANTIESMGKMNWIQRKFLDVKRNISSSYEFIRSLFGGSAIAKKMVNEMADADSKKMLMEGAYKDDLRSKLEADDNALDKALNKKIKLLDSYNESIEIQTDVLVDLYLHTRTEANAKIIKENGFVIRDTSTGKYHHFAYNNAMQRLVTDTIEKNKALNGYVKYIKRKYNGKLKNAYLKWCQKHFFATPNIVTDYYPEARYYKRTSSAEVQIIQPAIFAQSQNRTKNTLPMVIQSATNKYTRYIEDLARQIYIMPIYRDAIRMMNVKVNYKGKPTTLTKIFDDPRNSLSSKDLQVFKTTMDEWAGVKEHSQASLADALLSGYTIAKLSFNASSMLKQYASVFTSNYSLKSIGQAYVKLMKQLFSKDETWKHAYDHLVDTIGGVKYRDSDSLVVDSNLGNADSNKVVDGIKQVGKVGMKGISFMDRVAISTGLVTAMTQVEAQGYKVGTPHFYKEVRKIMQEFLLSQIANNPNAKNGLSRSTSIIGRTLSFMQGAVRAAWSSTMNQFDFYARFKDTDIELVKEDYTKAQRKVYEQKQLLKKTNAQIDDLIAERDSMPKTKEFRDSKKELTAQINELRSEVDKQTSELVSRQATQEDLRIKKEDYKVFTSMGGKTIPFQIGVKLFAQGLLITLIAEMANRFLKGKDEKDAQELAMELMLNSSVNLVPVLGSLANSFIHNQELSAPSVSLITDTLNSIKDIGSVIDGSMTVPQFTRELLTASGEMLGVPVTNLITQANGIIKDFNPVMAREMNNILYNVSPTSATKAYNNYIAKGKNVDATNQLKFIMKTYKSGEVNDKVANELVDLSLNGFNALPKTKLSQYTNENDEVVDLSSQEQNMFYMTYSKSNKIVNNLLNVMEYKSATQEQKSKAISSIYNAYYEYAKAKALGLDKASSRLANLLLYTNGNIDISKYVMFMENVAQIKENGTKTRKELVLDYVNKTRLTKNDKYLLLILSGYSLSSISKDTNSFTNYLFSNGMSRTQINAFLGIN